MHDAYSRSRPVQSFVAVIVTAFVAGLLAVIAAPARADPPPVIILAKTEDNHLVVNWAPNGHRNASVFWNTDPTLNPGVGGGGSVVGVPLACIWTAGGPTCTGHQRAGFGTSMTSVYAVEPGTYYAQVEDEFDGTSPSHWDDSWHYSSVVQIIVSPPDVTPPPDATIQFFVPGRIESARRGRRYRWNFCNPSPRRGRICDAGSNQRNPSGGAGGPYIFHLKVGGGALPRGLTLNSRTGLLSGRPSGRPGFYIFVVCAVDFGAVTFPQDEDCRRIRLRVRR